MKDLSSSRTSSIFGSIKGVSNVENMYCGSDCEVSLRGKFVSGVVSVDNGSCNGGNRGGCHKSFAVFRSVLY